MVGREKGRFNSEWEGGWATANRAERKSNVIFSLPPISKRESMYRVAAFTIRKGGNEISVSVHRPPTTAPSEISEFPDLTQAEVRIYDTERYLTLYRRLPKKKLGNFFEYTRCLVVL